jgi:hypothetical protein
MPGSEFLFRAQDGARLSRPALASRRAAPRAVVQIAHGLAEHGGRYARLAAALNGAGYAAYASDLRGPWRFVRAKRPRPFRRKDGWAKCVKRPLDFQSSHRLRAARRPDRLSRLLDGLVSRPTLRGRTFGRARRFVTGAPTRESLIAGLTRPPAASHKGSIGPKNGAIDSDFPQVFVDRAGNLKRAGRALADTATSSLSD